MPKVVPLIVKRVPVGPDVGDRLVMIGFEITVKLSPLLGTPETVTTMLPVVAPLGTGTTMLVALQLVGVAAVPLKVTALLPCVESKFVPVMVMEVPTGPEVGEREEMLGGVVTVKKGLLLTSPLTVT